MTDREYVESTVAYLAEHVPWMYAKWLDECWWAAGSIGAKHETYKWVRVWLDADLNPKSHPLVSADWWDERDEPKLAELLRKQHADSILHDRGSTQVLHQDKEWTP